MGSCNLLGSVTFSAQVLLKRYFNIFIAQTCKPNKGAKRKQPVEKLINAGRKNYRWGRWAWQTAAAGTVAVVAAAAQ